MQHVVLVDENDNPIGEIEKMEAHEKGLLHRAFSVFIFNPQGLMLLQKRAGTKYHSADLWTNACCSHPGLDEEIVDAAVDRLQMEMGILTSLSKKFSFVYRAELDNGLIEHELDHVLFGSYDGEPFPNPEEVADWRYVSMEDLERELITHPEHFTSWFKLVFDQVKSELYQSGS